MPKLNDHIAQKIINFTEKPTVELANDFLKNGKYLWNSGIFMFKISTLFKEAEKFSSDIFKTIKKAYANKKKDLDFLRIDQNIFEQCESISIDNAIMEKTNLGTVIPLDAGWSDIGSWDSLWNSEIKDDKGNVEFGKVFTSNTKNTYLRSEHRLLVACGVEDMIIIETGDVVLIANKKYSQEILRWVNDK